MKSHVTISKQFLKDEARVDWHNKAVFNFRQKRDLTVKGIPEWEELREIASSIKENVLTNLDDYLIQFEEKAIANGVKVHWASDAKEHNEIVHGILKEHQVKHVVKSKSMLTEECGLNEYLEAKEIDVIDTDLGERIIQLRDEPPSHLIAPAIHLKREEVGVLFEDKLKTEKGNSDPTYLTGEARKHLREKFLNAQAGITGVNFAIADTGGVVVVTNEGNADLGCNIPPVQIHSVGIEKIIPRWEDLGVFTRMLAASATGQRISIYTSHYIKPKDDGEMHIVLVDNGRSEHLGREDFRNSLKCIRCAACMNTCPVYRRSGGYSYHSTIVGPIGAILEPGKDLKAKSDLPFASSLCGSCSDVCPVKIDIDKQLYRWRQIAVKEGHVPYVKIKGMEMAGKILSDSKSYNKWAGIAKFLLRTLPRWMIYNPLNAWGKTRELPIPPRQTFTEWYRSQEHISKTN